MTRRHEMLNGGGFVKRKAGGEAGFTLIELIMVIVILAILAAVAVPKYVNLTEDAKAANEAGVAAGVRAGILTFQVNQLKQNPSVANPFPDTLDAVGSNVLCSKVSPCFVNVLTQGGITDQWTKVNATTYMGPTGTNYVYTKANGEFLAS